MNGNTKESRQNNMVARSKLLIACEKNVLRIKIEKAVEYFLISIL
jgi:hypothetical protein